MPHFVPDANTLADQSRAPAALLTTTSASDQYFDGGGGKSTAPPVLPDDKPRALCTVMDTTRSLPKTHPVTLRYEALPRGGYAVEWASNHEGLYNLSANGAPLVRDGHVATGAIAGPIALPAAAGGRLELQWSSTSGVRVAEVWLRRV